MCVNRSDRGNLRYGPMLNNYEGGNVDLRVPYIGYSSESESYTAAGIAAYHALESHLEKRFSHGFQAGVSYTYSHATDEQSGLGLFYNGNNPDESALRLRLGRLRPHARSQLHLRRTRRQRSLPQTHSRARRSTAGRFTASPSSRAASLTASSTTPAPSAASTTAPSTASPIPSSAGSRMHAEECAHRQERRVLQPKLPARARRSRPPASRSRSSRRHHGRPAGRRL